MGLKLITPSYTGRGGSVLGITIKGDQLQFNNAVSNALGLTNKSKQMYFAFDQNDQEENTRLYLMNEVQAQAIANGIEPQGTDVAGNPDKGKRYVKARDIVIEGRLQHESTHTLLKDSNGYYIELDPKLAPQTFDKNKKPGKKSGDKTGQNPNAAKEIAAKKAAKETTA